MKTHFLAQSHNHTRWNRDLAPALEIESGDSVEMELRDSSDGQVQPDWTTASLAQLDRNRIHALTGPIFVKDARPGDSLEVRIESIEHQGWGWTSLIPGLGLLPERFPDFFLHIWKLEQATTTLGPANIPLRPFCGIMGVAPEEPGEHRTRPPGRFGGNLDVRQLSAGAKLYLPVCVEGALFSAGDTHAAQGDGEVCINGIEMPAKARFTFVVHKDRTHAEPWAEAPPAPRHPDSGSWVFIASRTEFWPAAKCVVEQAIDFISGRYGISPELAYILCSITLDLKVSQCVNQPMITLSGHLPKSILPPG